AKSEPVTGYVREGSAPLPQALVKLESWHNSSLLRLQARTDEHGKFTLEGVPDDTATYSISATNYSNYRYSTQPRNNEMSFTVRRPFMAFGKVLDAETRQPINDFTIVQGYRYNTNEPLRWQRYNKLRGRGGEYSQRMSDYGSSSQHFISVEANGYLPQ